MSIKKYLSRIFLKRALSQISVHADEHGLKIMRDDELRVQLFWPEVEKIIAYKYDVYSMDEICVGFCKEIDAEDWFEISENWSGFERACEAMQAIFPDLKQEWMREVMFPPFERCETILWVIDTSR